MGEIFNVFQGLANGFDLAFSLTNLSFANNFVLSVEFLYKLVFFYQQFFLVVRIHWGN